MIAYNDALQTPPSYYNTVQGILDYFKTTAFSASTDLSGTATSQTVIAIQGNAIASGTPSDGYTLVYKHGTLISQWTPQFLTDSSIAAANKDGYYGTACMRTLGIGSGQAMPGNLPTFQGYSENMSSPGIVGGMIIIDCHYNIANIAHSLNITAVSFTNLPAAGQSFSLTLIFTQSSGGTATIAWTGPTIKWAGGTIPTFITTGYAVNIVSLMTTDGGVTWFGFNGGMGF